MGSEDCEKQYFTNQIQRQQPLFLGCLEIAKRKPKAPKHVNEDIIIIEKLDKWRLSVTLVINWKLSVT